MYTDKQLKVLFLLKDVKSLQVDEVKNDGQLVYSSRNQGHKPRKITF